MNEFNPPIKQASHALSQAIFGLALDVIVTNLKDGLKENIDEFFISYPNRRFSQGHINRHAHVTIIAYVLDALGKEGRRCLSTQRDVGKKYPMQVISDKSGRWSVMFDFIDLHGGQDKSGVVTSLIIHRATKESLTSYDISVSKKRLDEVMDRDPQEVKAITRTSLKDAYATYVRFAWGFFKRRYVIDDIGWGQWSVVKLLSALDINSLKALLQHINDYKKTQYHLIVGQDEMAERQHPHDDDHPTWEIIATDKRCVLFILASDAACSITSPEWNLRKARRYRLLAEWEEKMALSKMDP